MGRLRLMPYMPSVAEGDCSDCIFLGQVPGVCSLAVRTIKCERLCPDHLCYYFTDQGTVMFAGACHHRVCVGSTGLYRADILHSRCCITVCGFLCVKHWTSCWRLLCCRCVDGCLIPLRLVAWKHHPFHATMLPCAAIKPSEGQSL